MRRQTFKYFVLVKKKKPSDVFSQEMMINIECLWYLDSKGCIFKVLAFIFIVNIYNKILLIIQWNEIMSLQQHG